MHHRQHGIVQHGIVQHGIVQHGTRWDRTGERTALRACARGGGVHSLLQDGGVEMRVLAYRTRVIEGVSLENNFRYPLFPPSTATYRRTPTPHLLSGFPTNVTTVLCVFFNNACEFVETILTRSCCWADGGSWYHHLQGRAASPSPYHPPLPSSL